MRHTGVRIKSCPDTQCLYIINSEYNLYSTASIAFRIETDVLFVAGQTALSYYRSVSIQISLTGVPGQNPKSSGTNNVVRGILGHCKCCLDACPQQYSQIGDPGGCQATPISAPLDPSVCICKRSMANLMGFPYCVAWNAYPIIPMDSRACIPHCRLYTCPGSGLGTWNHCPVEPGPWIPGSSEGPILWDSGPVQHLYLPINWDQVL